MAAVLDNFTFDPKMNASKYPWSDWTDGRIWKVTKGIDFTSEVKKFRSQLYSKAGSSGLSVRTQKHLEESIVFQFYVPEEKVSE